MMKSNLCDHNFRCEAPKKRRINLILLRSSLSLCFYGSRLEKTNRLLGGGGKWIAKVLYLQFNCTVSAFKCLILLQSIKWQLLVAQVLLSNAVRVFPFFNQYAQFSRSLFLV